MTENKTTLASALLAARKAMRTPKLNSENPHFHSRFVSRDEVLDVIIGALADEGVFFSQGIFDGCLHTMVWLGDNTATMSQYPVPDIADPQKYAAALTYASRISMMLAFGLAGERDDDGNTAAAKPKLVTFDEFVAAVKAHEFADVVKAQEGYPTSKAAWEKLDATTRDGYISLATTGEVAW